MKKLLLAFDGTHFSEGAFEFARKLNELEPVLLTGAFLPQVDYANLWSYAGGGMAGPMYVPLVEGDDVEEMEKNMERFKELCVRNGIDFRVHNDFSDFAMPALKKESRFADALIIGSETFYSNLGVDDPNEYLQEALHGVECPVVIVPEKFEFPESVILAYDGSDSSVFSIKQFAYIFPELAKRKTLLLNMRKSEGAEAEFPDQSFIEELVARHYGDLTFFKFDVDSRKALNEWLNTRKATILVSGSYSRSSVSRLFHRSFIRELIAEHMMPIFNAHC